jgi:hypothetical protein
LPMVSSLNYFAICEAYNENVELRVSLGVRV